MNVSEVMIDKSVKVVRQQMDKGEKHDVIIACLEQTYLKAMDGMEFEQAILVLASLSAHAVYHLTNLKTQNRN
jgi:hypothetical protein